MPLESMAKVTSICGTPRGAGGMPTSSKRPSDLFSPGHLALALEDVDLDRVLVVGDGGEDLRALGGDGGVALDQLGEQAAVGLDAERQRGDVEQHHVLDVAAQDAGLDRGAHRHHLVGVDVAVGLAGRRSRSTAAMTSGVRVWPPTSSTSSTWSGAQAGGREGVAAGPLGALDQVAHEVLEVRRGVRVRARWRGPDSSAEMKGRLIAASSVDDSSHLARSAASLRRWRAMRSWRRSMPVSPWKSSISQSMIRWSKSSPPR